MVAYRDSFRPLGEEIAPADARDGIEIEAARCEYEGSRFHHALPMNISSLRQFANHWHLVLPTISTLRDGIAACAATTARCRCSTCGSSASCASCCPRT